MKIKSYFVLLTMVIAFVVSGQNVKDHLKVLYESANIIVTITPPDINQFSEGNIKLLDKSKYYGKWKFQVKWNREQGPGL